MRSDELDSLREMRARLRQEERWIDLANLLERWRSQSSGVEAAGMLAAELAELYEFMLQMDDAGAIRFAEERLEALYRGRGGRDDLEALAAFYLDKAERHSDEIQAYVAARLACADVFERDLKRPDAALLVLITALGSDVLFAPGVVDRLGSLAEQTGQWAELLEAVDDVVGQMPDDPRLGDLLKHQAEWCATGLADRGRVVQYLQRAVDVRPNDLEAIDTLASFYRSAGDRDRLAAILRLRANALPDPERRADVWLELANLLSKSPDAREEAVTAYQQVLNVRPLDADALLALDELFSETERWSELARVLEGRLRFTRDPADRAELERRLAEILGRAGEVEQAIARFRHTARDARDFISILKREAEALTPAAAARLYSEVGRVYEHELGDALSAHRYYERALSADSQIIDAAEPLADAYLAEQRWDKAAPLLEAMLRNSKNSDTAWLHRRWRQFAHVCDRLGRKGPALSAFREAYQLNSRDIVTLKGLARLLFDNEQWEEALRILIMILERHEQELKPAEVIGVHYMRGVALDAVGQRRAALDSYASVVERNPRHRDALRELVHEFGERKDWPHFVQYADLLVEVESEPLVRFRQFSKVGEVWASQLNRPDLAMKAYRAALDIKPDSIVVLRKLLDLYTKTEKYPLAVKVLERLLAHEENPHRKAALHYTAGVLYRDHVGDGASAVRHFEAALDADLEMIKAFEAIDRILTAAREWKELERAYRRMLLRLKNAGGGEKYAGIELLLWEGLAEIYRSRLGHYESAINAFNVLRNLKGDDEKLHLILAELYEKTGDADGALAEHRALIALDPKRVDSFHALHSIYMHQGRFDAAWCVSGVLSFFRAANAHEESLYQKYLGRNLRLAHGALTLDAMQHLYHPDEDLLTSSILSFCAEHLRPLYGLPLKNFGLNPRKAEIPEGARDVVRHIFDYVVKTLASPSKPLLLRGDQDGPEVAVANAETQVVVLGPARARSNNDRETAFYLGKVLFGMRPEHYLAFVGFPAEMIQTLMLSALEACEPSLGYSKHVKDPNFERAIKTLRALPPPAILPLAKAVRAFLERGEAADIPRWLRAVEHTTNRAGLLLCGDLGCAASCVRYGNVSVGGVHDEEKLKELVVFAASESYMSLRRQLRLAIDDGGVAPWA